LVQEAWDNYSKTRDIDDQKQALKLQEHYTQTISDASRAVSILKITQDNVQKAFDAAKKAGIGIIILEVSTQEPTEKLEQITKINSIEKYLAAIKEAKSVEQKAIAEMRSFLFDLGKDVKHASSYPEFIKANLVQLQIELSVPGFVSEIKPIEIPFWIKNNAEWWAEGKISDQEFIKGIEYLIQNQVIDFDETYQIVTYQDAEFNQILSDVEVPSWIKNNAEWWAEGKISDQEFIKGVEFLLENGIMAIDEGLIKNPPQSTATIKPNEEVTIQSEDGRVTVLFPVGSVQDEIEASISLLNKKVWPTELKEREFFNQIYSLEPSDVIFSKSPEITMRLLADDFGEETFDDGIPLFIPAIILSDGTIQTLTDSQIDINTATGTITLKGKTNHFSKPVALVESFFSIKLDPADVGNVRELFSVDLILSNNDPGYSTREVHISKIQQFGKASVTITKSPQIIKLVIPPGDSHTVELTYECLRTGKGSYIADVTIADHPFLKTQKVSVSGNAFCIGVKGKPAPGTIVLPAPTTNQIINTGPEQPPPPCHLVIKEKHPDKWPVEGSGPFSVTLDIFDETGRELETDIGSPCAGKITSTFTINTKDIIGINENKDSDAPPQVEKLGDWPFPGYHTRVNEEFVCLDVGPGSITIKLVILFAGERIRTANVECVKDKAAIDAVAAGQDNGQIETIGTTSRIKIKNDFKVKGPDSVNVDKNAGLFYLKYTYNDKSIIAEPFKFKNNVQLKVRASAPVEDVNPGKPSSLIIPKPPTFMKDQDLFQCTGVGKGLITIVVTMTKTITSGKNVFTTDTDSRFIEHPVECTEGSEDKRVGMIGSDDKKYAALIDSLGDPNDGYVLISQIDDSVFESEEKTITSVDSDGDGIPDDQDNCPTQVGVQSNSGCPEPTISIDSDGDGIPDDQDNCPTQAGVQSNSGCPEPTITMSVYHEIEQSDGYGTLYVDVSILTDGSPTPSVPISVIVTSDGGDSKTQSDITNESGEIYFVFELPSGEYTVRVQMNENTFQEFVTSIS